MLSCQQVATLASDYLDKNTHGSLKWQMRMHLMMCANCRRFMRHLKITQQLAAGMAQQSPEVDAEQVLIRVKESLKKHD